MNSKNIIVTGGAGYIGSHTCKALARSGFTPVAYDNLVCGHKWAVKWGPLEIGDIADTARLMQVFSKYRPAAVMHFAAFAYVGESVSHPLKYYRNNLGGTLSLLDAMTASGLDKLIFSSTCSTYGMPLEVPITEKHPQNPINPYGASKFMVEQVLKDVGKSHGIQSLALRYFNAAGADPETEIGESHEPETHLIPLVLDVAAGKRHHVTIFGDDYQTGDGTCVRDYIHVTDLAQAHVLALQKLLCVSNRNNEGERRNSWTSEHSPVNGESSAEVFRVYNLGNGQGFSVKEVIATAEKVTGRDIRVQIGKRRPGDPSVLVGNAAMAVRELGWRPEYADLEKIINTAWQWHQKLDVP